MERHLGRRGLGAIATAAIAVSALAACSTPRSSSPPVTSPTVSTSSSPYVDAPSDSATPTTAPGTTLGIGDDATVWWKPTSTKKALLDLKVTAVHRTTFKQSFKGWKITPRTAKATPYFVEATVSSQAAKIVAGRQVPLYALDSKDQLVQASSFKQAFTPCSPSVFPLHAKAGRSSKVCLVFLVPDRTTLTGVTYRPDQSLAPITWKGAATALTGKKGTKP